MTPEQVIDLLTLAAGFDRRTVGKADVHAWLAALGDLDSDDAQAAVIAHYRDSTDWLMPAHIRQRVKAMRDERLTNSDLVIPPPPPDQQEREAEYRTALTDIRRHLGDGQPPPFRAIEAAGHDDPSSEYRQTRDTFTTRRKAQILAQARDAEPATGEPCDGCGADRDPDGICRACQTWRANS